MTALGALEADNILFSQIEKIKEREAVARKAVISLGIRVSLGGITILKWNLTLCSNSGK